MTIADKRTAKIIRRVYCTNSDERVVAVFQCRYFVETLTPHGMRKYPGAKYWMLATGEPIRQIDPTMFEVIGSGEMLYSEDGITSV